MNQQIEFLSDGGETIRDLQLYLSPEAEHLLDWFHTQDEVRRLFAVITSKRDRAPLQLTYHYGLRASEVSLLQRDDIHETQGRIYIPRVKGSIAKTYPMQPEDVRLVGRTCVHAMMTHHTCLSPCVVSPWNAGRIGT